MSSLIPSPTVSLVDGKPMVSSRDVALRFQRRHKHVLDEIKRLISICPESFCGPNFRPTDYMDEQGKPRPAYNLTRDAFTLLAMGFTGRAAIQWKLRYIEAFNALEQAALDSLRRQIADARSAALAEGLALASSLSPLMLARLGKIRSYRERGFSQREISAVMGLHRRTVRQLEKLLPGFAAGGSVQEARHETR